LQYYYSENGKAHGPVEKESLKGKILRDTLIWFDGLEDWKKASEIPELLSVFQNIPPPLPDERKKEKDNTVDVRILNETKPIISAKGEVKLANEIRSNFLLLVFSTLIAFIAFIVFDEYKSSELRKLDSGFKTYEDGLRSARESDFISGSVAFGEYYRIYETNNKKKLDSLFQVSRSMNCYTEDQIPVTTNMWGQTSYYSSPSIKATRNTIKMRLNYITIKSKEFGYMTLLISALILIFGRYVIKGFRWVGDRT